MFNVQYRVGNMREILTCTRVCMSPHVQYRVGNYDDVLPSNSSLSASGMPSIRVVNRRFTNRDCRPLSGCVRTTGCSTGGLAASAPVVDM